MKPLLTGLALVCLVGCQSLQDQETLRPLPEPGPKPTQTYTDLLLRARRQADLALDRSLRNVWLDVEEAGRAIQQTARLLPLAQDAPAKKPELDRLWADLAALAKKLEVAAKEIVPLKDAAREKKQKEIDAIILDINRNVRTLRAMN